MVRLAIEGRSACDQRARAFRSSEGPGLGGATANPEPPMIFFELDHSGSIIAVATAPLKLPNRRRIVFSDGRMAASVQLSAVGIEPCSATNLRRAATASAIRVSAMSGIGTASPSNTPGGFALWELRSTNCSRPSSAICISRDLPAPAACLPWDLSYRPGQSFSTSRSPTPRPRAIWSSGQTVRARLWRRTSISWPDKRCPTWWSCNCRHPDRSTSSTRSGRPTSSSTSWAGTDRAKSVALVGWRQTDDRDLAIGLFLISGVARRYRGDARQRLLPLIAFERIGDNPQLSIADLEPDLVRALGQVDEPGRMRRRAAFRSDHQPRVLAVGETTEDVGSLVTGARSDRRQQDRREAHHLGRCRIFRPAIPRDLHICQRFE